MSLEPPVSHKDPDLEGDLVSQDASIEPLVEDTPRPSRRRYSRAFLGLGVFTLLSGGILLVAHQLMPANSMAGMEGHDMGEMSHDDMMQVDGAFNPVPVTVETTEPGAFEAGVSYTGSIMPYEEVVVYPRVAGQLTNFSVYAGDRVESGQVLAQLEATERVTELAGARAEANVRDRSLLASQAEVEEQNQEIARLQAELDYLQLRGDRFKALAAEGAISQDEYDIVASQIDVKRSAIQGAKAMRSRLAAQVEQERSRVDQAQAEVDTAAVMEGYTTLTSPVSGLVQDRMVDPGVVVQPSMGVLRIGDYSRVRLQANVSQQDAGYVRIGMPIEAKVPGATEKPITGQITSIFPKTNSDTRTVMVEALIDNPNERLLSGQFLEMTIFTGQDFNALSVPRTAVADYNGEPSVWVIEGSAAQQRTVETGMASGDRIEITSGLSPGEQVITSGHSRLVPGTPVTVVDDVGNPVPVLGESSQGSIEAVIVSPDLAQGLNTGGAELTLEIRDPETQAALPVEDVAVEVTMPMANMAPMTTMVQMEPADGPGRFQVKTHFGMAGDWQINVEVKDPDHAGQALIVVPVE
ncbi:MAG: efflux RND transporter periplasmic adaptor subunit [Elainellaceae cyanobacterium]